MEHAQRWATEESQKYKIGLATSVRLVGWNFEEIFCFWVRPHAHPEYQVAVQPQHLVAVSKGLSASLRSARELCFCTIEFIYICIFEFYGFVFDYPT